MKRVNNIYSEVYNLNNIINMTNKVLSKTKNKYKVYMFELYKFEHFFNIYRRLYLKDIGNIKYNIFMINDPKPRIIMAEDIEDKIINHLIAKYLLNEVFESKYDECMCATRIGKGTLYGIRLLKKYLNDMKNKYDNFYVLKLDIRKYFYNIDHYVLKNIICKKIKDNDAIDVLFKIIDSTNNDYVNVKIKKLKDKRIEYLNSLNIHNKDKLIKEVESIPLYKYGKGVALGNQTSQAFGLIYMYEIIHYMKEELKLSRQVNYMDDIIILHSDKEYLKSCLDKITNKLKYEYKLDINIKKTRIDNISNGINFLGYYFYLKNNKIIIKLSNKNKVNIKKKLSKCKNKLEYIFTLNKYNGLFKWGDCHNLYYRTIRVFIGKI